MSRAITKWALAFAALGWAVWDFAVTNDNDPNTWPLTHLVIYYLTPWGAFGAAVALCGWLLWHFWPGTHSGRPSPKEGLIMSEAGSKWAVRKAAVERAVRTLVAGCLATALSAAGTALTVAITPGVTWTREYWVGVAVAVETSVVAAVISYVRRYFGAPPKTETVKSVAQRGGTGVA